ncbi:unnamed protein product, partial [Owenia fusiformis]
ETQTQHLPELLRQVTISLTNHCTVLSDDELKLGLKLSSKILAKTQPMMSPSGPEGDSDAYGGLSTVESSPVKHWYSYNTERRPSLGKDTESDNFVSAESDFDSEHLQNSPVKSNCQNESEKSVQSETFETRPKSESFAEFVQYNESDDRNGAIENSADKPSAPPVEIAVDEITTTMQSCVQVFQNFFITLVKNRVIGDGSLLADCMKAIKKKTAEETENNPQ